MMSCMSPITGDRLVYKSACNHFTDVFSFIASVFFYDETLFSISLTGVSACIFLSLAEQGLLVLT